LKPIIGPLGWPYPILNILRRIIERIRERRKSFSILQNLDRSSALENIEEVVWIDWKGRERKIIIHRKVD